ncbi:MAG TPA: prolipoprotein diacylglyceryl transferase [Xanthomonadales bacterium]|nr:prolipoprotein diacylglyceryl transferase [Xanthomonadales bacterium]
MIFFNDLDPVAVHLGPVPIRWYGLMYIAGGVVGLLLGRARWRQGRLAVERNSYEDLIFYAMLGVIVGGRIGYMLFYSHEWLRNPLAILKVWEGGMSFHGGLLGVILATVLWSRKQKKRFWDTIDFVAPLVPLGLGLGRLGNFIGGELWGAKTNAGWGVVFPNALEHLGLTVPQLRAMFEQGLLNGEARHPTQLYEAFLEGVVMFAVLWWFSAKPRPRYAVSGLFALMYGVFRFAIEFVRQPDAQLGYLAFGWVTMGQVLSLPLIVIGLVLLWLSRRSPVAEPVLPDATPAA